MWHTIFITIHAVTGGLALLFGLAMLRYRLLFPGYLAATIGMEVFLLLAIAAEWGGIGFGTRLLFGALAALGAFVVWCAVRARSLRPARDERPSRRYFRYVGFTLVAQFDAFVVIDVLNVGAPGWAAAASGVLIAIPGHFVLRWADGRVTGGTRGVVRPAIMR